MFQRGRLFRGAAVATLAIFLPIASSGCFGGFNLTRKVYKFNHDFSNDKWVNWLAFVVLSLTFVYAIVVFVDVIVGNSFEFWTGENPINVDSQTRRYVDEKTGRALEMTLLPDRRIENRIFEPDGSVVTFFLEKTDQGVAVYDAGGRLVARAGDVLGLEFASAR